MSLDRMQDQEYFGWEEKLLMKFSTALSCLPYFSIYPSYSVTFPKCGSYRKLKAVLSSEKVRLLLLGVLI